MMKLIRRLAALVMMMSLLAAVALADAATPTDLPAADAASVTIAQEAPVQAPAAQPVREVRIECAAQDIRLGDTIVLNAVLTGYDQTATLRWLVDGVVIEGATSASLTVQITEQNCQSVYTVEVTAD